uniref:NAC domain-containing protein n=1 Tax=Quercus lobata TaxID=97700 RepID=A0A7N2M2E7_QUELO
MSFLRRRLPLPLPMGARFEPSDAVLISSYLSPKIRNEVLAWDVIGFSDEVYDKPPWDFCTDSTVVLDDEKHYFFTLLKRGKNRVLRSVGSYGTWHESSTKKIYDSGSGKTIIGFNKLLNFRVKGEGKEMKTTDWLMHEFSVAEKGSDLVLCVIYKKNKKKEERAWALALERPPSVVVDSGILGSPKSVFDQVDFFDGIDDTDMGGQDPYDDQDPVFDFGILGSPKSVFDQVDFFDDTGMGGQDPYDDQDPFDGSPRFAAIDGHSQFQVLDSREDGLTKKMGSEVEGFDGFDEAEVEGLLLDLADDTEPDFDPMSFLNLLDSEEDARPSKKMRCDFSDIIKESITVGVIGLPNVDCPGVVMIRFGANDASITLRNCKRIEKLDDPTGPVKEILRRCPPSMLVTLYKLPSFDSVDDFLQEVAIVRGKLKKGGVVDVEAAERIVLHDWNQVAKHISHDLNLKNPPNLLDNRILREENGCLSALSYYLLNVSTNFSQFWAVA